jgi:hypothetical protein
MNTLIVTPRKYDKEAMQTTATLPAEKTGKESSPFQWMLYKPQAHAIAPFDTHTQSRLENSVRK